MINYNTDSALRLIKTFDQIIREDGGDTKSDRNSFLKSLFLLLRKQPYGVMNEAPNFKPFSASVGSMSIVVIPELIDYLIKFVNQSKYIKQHSVTSKNGHVVLQLKFERDSCLTIVLLQRFISRGLHFALTQKALLNAEVNAYGIKQLSRIDALEYSFCANQINSIGISGVLLNKIMPPLKSERVRLYNYINNKYGQTISSVDQLTRFNSINNQEVLKVIKSKKENKGVSGWKHKFIYWKERTSELINKEIQFKIPTINKVGKPSLLQTIKTILGILMGG